MGDNAPMSPAEALRLIDIDQETLFVLSRWGRIERQGPPDNSAGPRLHWAACEGGARVRFGPAVSEETVARIEALAASAPAWVDPDLPHPCGPEITALLEREAPVASATTGPIFALPNGLAFPHPARLVRGDTDDGEALLGRLARGAWPAALAEAGFRGVEDFWRPWVVALDGEEIAAMAFAARLGARGAEIGVYTFAPYRGRRLAAAVTAAWASLPGLAKRALFYSTLSENHSSRRVAARLGLTRIGASLSIL